MGTSFCSTLTTCTSSGAGAVAPLVGPVQPASHDAPVNTKAMRNAGIVGLRIGSLSFRKQSAILLWYCRLGPRQSRAAANPPAPLGVSWQSRPHDAPEFPP